MMVLALIALTSCKKQAVDMPQKTEKVKVFVKIDAVDNTGAILDTQVTSINY